jgi:hypothetical protein
MRRSLCALAVACATIIAMVEPGSSNPPTPNIAKACRELAIKQYPRTTAGSKHGSAKAQRDYFRDCVTKQQAERKTSGQPPR